MNASLLQRPDTSTVAHQSCPLVFPKWLVNCLAMEALVERINAPASKLKKSCRGAKSNFL